MTTDRTLIEKQDASIPLTVCPQRLDALTDMLRLTHEGAMRTCHILVPILLFESLYGGFIPNPGETVVVVLVAQDARASRLSHRLVRPVRRHPRVGGLVSPSVRGSSEWCATVRPAAVHRPLSFLASSSE